MRPIPWAALVPDSIPFEGATCDCEDEDPGRALGFNGDKAGGLVGSTTCPSLTFRRTVGRPGATLGPPTTLIDGRVSTVNPDGPSPPNACRRAFSCRICTARKWERSSCHLMSSRASLDRVAIVETAALCK